MDIEKERTMSKTEQNRSTNTKRENRSRIKIIGNCTEASSADALDPQ